MKSNYCVLIIFNNVASTVAHKDSAAAITGFHGTFGDHAATRLIVRISNATLPGAIGMLTDPRGWLQNNHRQPGHERLKVDALNQESDAVMSLHRLEGSWLTIAEGMLRAIPVIASNWSGNADFPASEIEPPVLHRLMPTEDPEHTYHFPGMSWADNHADAAASALRWLRAFAARVGQCVVAYAGHAWSAEGYASLVRSHHYI